MRPRSLIHPALLSGYCFLLSFLACATALAAEPSPTSGAETTPSAVVLPEMTVSARPEPSGEIGYSVPNPTAATKTDTPIMETPVSIQVIPQQVLRDQQVIAIKDALKNISGVQPNLTYGALYDNFIVRGFGTDSSTYRNGLRQTTLGFETTNLERIEVLKGPAAVLFGRIEPGGLINLVTKRPLAEPYYALQQQFGSYDLYRTTAEATGPLIADHSLLYRLDFAYQDSNSFQDFVFLDRFFVAPALTWRPTDRLELNLSYEHQEDDLNFANGVPALGRRPAPVPISFSSDNGDDFYEQDRDLVAFDWSYQFLEGWKVTNRFTAYFANDDSFDVIGFDTISPDDRFMDRVLWDVVFDRNTYATNLDLTGRFNTWGARHNMLIGFDYYRLEDDGHGVCCPAVAPIDVFNPVYGVVDEAAISAATGENMFSTNNTVWYGLYFQDQITLWDKLRILGGGRYDWATAVDGFSGTSLADARANDTESTDEAFSLRVGLVYQPWPWLSVYGNYVESLGSNNGQPAPGQPQFDPEHGQQYEVGFKTEFWDGRLSSTLAFYHLTKQNVLTADPQNPRFQRAIGEARSQGIELDIAGQLTDEWKLLASYSYTDAEIIKDTDCIQFDADFTCLTTGSGSTGNRLPNVAEHSASFWTTYDITQAFTLGTGVFMASNKAGDPENSFALPGLVRWDMMAAYRIRLGKSRLTTQINVNNILDKEYYQSANNTDGLPRSEILAAEPLTFLGSIRLEY